MDIEIAKEILKGIDIKFFLNGMTEQSNYIVDKADEINIAIDVVLSELETSKKETQQVLDDYQDLGKEKYKLECELEKKDKIIELMANKLVEAHDWFYSEFDNFSKEDFIKYFTKKATDNVGE